MEATDRKIAAQLARRFYSSEIDFDQFCMDYPEYDKDKDISELYDLIEHEPKKGGFFGISSDQHESYIQKIFRLIEKLDKD